MTETDDMQGNNHMQVERFRYRLKLRKACPRHLPAGPSPDCTSSCSRISRRSQSKETGIGAVQGKTHLKHCCDKLYSALRVSGLGWCSGPGLSMRISRVMSYDLASLTLKWTEPTMRSPLFAASGSGSNRRACLGVCVSRDAPEHGRLTHCQCVRGASGPVDSLTSRP
jgi:hypothetical protein